MINYILMKRGYKVSYSLEDLKSITCEVLELDKGSLNNRTRKRDVVDARKIYCEISKTHSGYSLESIGESIGRHHASVIHLVKGCKDLKSIDKQFYSKYLKVRSNLSL